MAILLAMTFALYSCDNVDTNRIPAYKVQINLNNAGLWNTYGVGGYGQYRLFIRDLRLPSNYSYTETTYTGFGGVLLTMGMDPFGQGEVIPLAYDLACPVECTANVRVYVDENTLEAVCPTCGSHYNIMMSGGAPISGPAATESVKYGLQRYSCVANNGGYIITR